MATAVAEKEKQTIVAEKRTESGKGVARKLRAAGRVPGTLYGHGLKGATSLTVDPDAMYDLLTTRRRKNVVFRLDVEGDKYEDVMVKDYQIDPVRRDLLHADFQVIDATQPVAVLVPVEATGRAAGVKAGGRLQMVRDRLPVLCLPNDIPVVLTHDVTELKMGQAILASELELPEGLEPNWSVDFAVVRVAIPRGAELLDEEEEGEEGEEGAEGAEDAEGEGTEAEGDEA